MSNSVFQRWNEIVGGAFALNQEAFQQIATLPQGLWLALLVVLLSGLGLAVGQSIILFINRVRPGRFLFSLLLNAVLFTFGFIFLALSTWLICLVPWSIHVPFRTLIKVLGLGYAPLLFSFFGALPYFGNSITTILSVWNLLAMVVGFSAIAQVGPGVAFGYVAFGWFVKQLLEGTIGQPIARLGRTLVDWVAGVNFTRRRSQLRELLLSGTQPASPIIAITAAPRPEMQRLQEVGRTSLVSRSTPAAASPPLASPLPASPPATSLTSSQRIAPADPLAQLQHQTQRIPQPLKLALSLLLMALAFLLVLVLLRPIRSSFFGWYDHLPNLFQLIFDLVWIGVVAIVFAGFLAPLESLGWWAGWYGDDLDTEGTTGGARASRPDSEGTRNASGPPHPARYLVYLDGIGQSGQEYTPDVETFLRALRPALPQQMELVQGLMMYSVLNKPLDEDRPLAFLWRKADQVRWTNPAALLGLLVNLRNVIIVAVSSDKRYGPIYNQGIAQVVADGLLERGYQLGSGIPITLIGYSGGGEMSVACAPYLKRAIGAPIDVISLGGVMSANNNVLKLEHLYHVVGEKDSVERLGPIMFPGRWPLFALSYWNRAKRKGKITILSAGPVGHQVPGGYMDPEAKLPDGRTNLQQTIDIILRILRGEALSSDQTLPRKTSNYALYQALAYNQPAYYPIDQTVDLNYYCPMGSWMGRLILPKLTERFQGVWFEVHYAPPEQQHLIGQTVRLCWANDPVVQRLVKAVTKDVHFSVEAEFSSKYGGLIHPDRINHWQQVDPLESLAGSHPVDDLIVKLSGTVEVEEGSPASSQPVLFIYNTPIQITGRFYALVQFLHPLVGTDQFQVVHFNRQSRQFDGLTELMRLPQVGLAAAYGSYPSTTRDLERSPLNQLGWYVYGAKDAQGQFVVQALAPRSLFQLQPETVISGRKAAYRYIHQRAWADTVSQKGQIASVLCIPQTAEEPATTKTAVKDWRLGDQALVLHTYGGIGGHKKEPAAASPIFFGHFAYGLAEVVRDPLADELRFEICYYQVYTHNTDGLIAGVLHWSRYLGDRQFGWAGTRPTCDLLIKLDAFTQPYEIAGIRVSALQMMLRQLQVMTARYRIGDGTGGTYVGPANNCAQDSNQALFASLSKAARDLQNNPQIEQALLEDVNQSQRFQVLCSLSKDLSQELQTLGGPRADWEQNEYNLGSTLEDNPLQNLWTGLGSWRTMLPRLASDTIVKSFLQHGASVWVLRTNQIGGFDPEIQPIAPITL